MSSSSRKKDKKRKKAIARRDARGRLHLVLHRDSASGGEHLTLASPLFKEAWQNELVAGAANTAHGTLGGAPTLARAIELARHAMAATSRLIEALLARAPEGALACKAGCDHCCYQVVGVTPPEALAIAEHVRETRTPEELAELTRHVSELVARGRGLSATERFSPEHPCIFLKDGRCTIYEVRPLSCRGMNSLDAGECAKRLRDPEARAEFIAGRLGGHTFMEPIRAFHAISAGVQLTLAELYRLDMHPVELGPALHLLLTGSSTLAEDWLAGRSPFESVRSADRRDDLAMQEASGVLTGGPG